MKQKHVLILMSPASQARLNGIAHLAREREWTLMIESEVSRPPTGWRGDGALVTMKDDSPQLDRFVRELLRGGVPVVNVSGHSAGLWLPTVCGDDPRIGRLAAEHFAERRFENAAWFSTRWGRVQQQRFAAFSAAWRSAVPSAAAPLRLVWSERSGGRQPDEWSRLSRWLGDAIAAAPKPLGVFAYSDYDASRVLSICRARGLDVPGEVAVLGVDNNPIICDNQTVPISSVNHDLERIGYCGAALLERLMNGARAPRKPLLVAPNGITLRRSTDTVAVNHPVLRSAVRRRSRMISGFRGSGSTGCSRRNSILRSGAKSSASASSRPGCSSAAPGSRWRRSPGGPASATPPTSPTSSAGPSAPLPAPGASSSRFWFATILKALEWVDSHHTAIHLPVV